MDNNIVNDYLAYSNISVPTIVTYTILKQPEIITIMNKINKIDVSILERKISNFIGNNILNDESSIVLIIFLCSLMYKNNIFPQYINDILKQLNINNVSVQELQENSENLKKIKEKHAEIKDKHEETKDKHEETKDKHEETKDK
jgi:hypothetical protein